MNEARCGPDLEGCASLSLKDGGSRQLAAYDLRVVLATDRHRHHIAFFRVPPDGGPQAAAPPGWCSYGIYADGRLSAAGGVRPYPDLLDGHLDDDPSNITCLMFEQREAQAGEAALADLSLNDGPEAASVGAASAALLSGFVAGLEGSRLRRYADEAGLDGGGGRRQLESRVLPRLRGEVQGWLAALADAPRQELQARCRAAGLEGEGSAGELALRLVVPQLQQRFGLI